MRQRYVKYKIYHYNQTDQSDNKMAKNSIRRIYSIPRKSVKQN